MKGIAILLIVLSLGTADCQSLGTASVREKTNNFQTILRKNGLLIRQVVPPKFTPVAVDAEIPFRHNYAIKSTDGEIEIRYKIISIPEYLKEFEEVKKNYPQAILVPPKKDDYLKEFIMNLQNLAGKPENIMGSKPFPEKAVKDEFGADWGSSSHLILNPEYDKKYTYCMLVVLHKDQVADVYVMYLAKDLNELTKFLKETHLFYNIRFL
ncbi:hypothetical protein EHO60_03285 [Leptospira fletcheri]|uniref:Uncharacterized protein n=1 Tax=Leptospira fletcheri TaxID=2484981 RepID=A0A4R9GIQ7_9LEPT|nr:hypothetical protein [Leptospira fletcheri]TGK12911.1 hypothetical protein EHO60_03285 [Leptospira fletcheri]